jgi:hypothetical protein
MNIPRTTDATIRLDGGDRQFGSMAVTEQLDGSGDLSAARDALQEHQWQEAVDLLVRADREGRLGATDLEALAQAAWFTAQPDLAVEAKERAFKAYLAAGNKARAAKMAFELSREYVSKLKFSIASAWAARGDRVLEGEPGGFAHGYQALSKSITAEHAGDVETAIKFAGQAVEIGTRFSDADIRAWGLLQQGQLLIAGGRTDEGFPLLEEATIAAVNGELNAFTARRSWPCRARWTERSRNYCRRLQSRPRTTRRRRLPTGSTRLGRSASGSVTSLVRRRRYGMPTRSAESRSPRSLSCASQRERSLRRTEQSVRRLRRLTTGGLVEPEGRVRRRRRCVHRVQVRLAPSDH